MLEIPAPRACVAMAPVEPAQPEQPGPESWMFGSVIALRSSAMPLKLNLLFFCFCVMAWPSCGRAITTIGSFGNSNVAPVARLVPAAELRLMPTVRYQVPLPGVCRYTYRLTAPLSG